MEGGNNVEGDYYRNCINGEVCYVEKNEEITTLTMLHIISELRIAPPYDLEDLYEIYLTFKTNLQNDPIPNRNIE